MKESRAPDRVSIFCREASPVAALPRPMQAAAENIRAFLAGAPINVVNATRPLSRSQR
jgi:hypothetical protein